MINYVVALYVGDRGNRSVNLLTKDPTYMAKRHLGALASLNVPLITKATFVVSPSGNPEADSCAVEFVQQSINCIEGIEIDCFIGSNNNNHSYGCWNFAMKKYIDDKNHFFLIEDDYFPTKDEFYLPFLEKIRSNTAYVSQLYVHNREHRQHAAISNGLMNVDAARAHIERFGDCINIDLPKKKPYDVGVYSQLHFLRKFYDLGYKMDDVSKEYCHPFLERNNRITLYGNTKGETLIEPVFYEDRIRVTYRTSSL